MQVSWIEPDQLRDLVGQLQRPAGTASNVAWELHTLPNPTGLGARELGIEEGDLWLPDEPTQSAAATSQAVAPPAVPADNFFAPVGEIEEHHQEESPIQPLPEQPKELWRIREKLRAIRERAIEAGLLAHVGVAKPPLAEEPALVVRAEEPAPPAVQSSETVPPVASPFSVAEPVIAPTPIFPSAPAVEATPFADNAPVVPSAPVVEAAPIADSAPVVPSAPAVEAAPFADSAPVVPSAPAVEADPIADNALAKSFTTPRGRIFERLEAFASWAGRQFGLHDLLIVDDHGDIIWGIHEHAGLVVSAMMACKAAQRASALGAAGLSPIIEQPISINRMLIVVPCETSYGSLTIAFVREGAFPKADALLLGHALTIAVEADVGPSPDAPPDRAALDWKIAAD